MKGTRRIKSIFSSIEQVFKRKWISKIPPNIETYHLTLLTIVWTVLVLLFYYIAKFNIQWLWAASLTIVLQYVTDLFDGALGRYRKTGLVGWGYYMDHMLDYVFLCAVLIGFSFLVQDDYKFLFFFILAICGAFTVHIFLAFAVTRVFKISYYSIGPTEVRLGVLFLNTAVIFLGKFFLILGAPIMITTSLVLLIGVVYKTQRRIWVLDMKQKRKKTY